MAGVVKVLPSREKASEIAELIKLGWSDRDIVDKVFGRHGAELTTTVRNVRRDGHAFDTDIDEVAVARALQGDAEVWAGLTHYERREVMLAIYARREVEREEDLDDARQLRQKSGQFNYVHPHGRTPEWLVTLADAAGCEPGRLVEVAREHVLARVL